MSLPGTGLVGSFWTRYEEALISDKGNYFCLAVPCAARLDGVPGRNA
jgi:hypothetical protein